MAYIHPCSGHANIWPDNPPSPCRHPPLRPTQGSAVHPEPPELLFWAMEAKGQVPNSHSKRNLPDVTKSNKMISYKTQWGAGAERHRQAGGARNKRSLATQRPIDPVTDFEWCLPPPRNVKVGAPGHHTGGNILIITQKSLGETSAICLCLIYLHLGSDACLPTL